MFSAQTNLFQQQNQNKAIFGGGSIMNQGTTNPQPNLFAHTQQPQTNPIQPPSNLNIFQHQNIPQSNQANLLNQPSQPQANFLSGINTAASGLFGNLAQNPSQGNLLFNKNFLAQTQTTTPLNPQATGTSNLFGLSGANHLQTGSFGLSNINQQQNPMQGQNPNLFGQATNINLQNKPQLQPNIFAPSSGQSNTPLAGSFNSLMYTNIHNKLEADKMEIINVVQSYLNCLNIKSNLNSFKYMLYNRITDDSAHLISLLQQPKNQDFTEEGEPFLIDQELWHKALRNNPNPAIFYPSQICSPKALDARGKILEILEYQKLDYLINLRQKINNLSALYDNDIQNINATIKNKLNLIKHKQMNVINKLEKLAFLTGKAEKDFDMENKLNLKLNSLKYALTNPDSYVNKLSNLSSMTTLMSFDNSNEYEDDPLKDFTKERFEKNMAVLKNMKKIFDLNFVNLRKSISDLETIKSDLDNFRKYDRITK